MNLRAVQNPSEEGLPGAKGRRAQENALDREALVWALTALTQAFRIPFDETLVTGQMPPPYGIDSIVQAADLLGLRAAWVRRPASALRKLSAPFLILLSPVLREPHHGHVTGPESLASLDSAVANQRLAFLLRLEGDRVALFEPGQARHTILPFSEFETRYAGQVLLAAPKEKKVTDPDALGAAGAKFGFRWFIPELLKHRRIFRDVLLASFAIQLMALATPLFTQVVIDKVIVHHTLNTLTVIGIGLAVFMIFTAAMTWVRQYLILHMGNRIDAVLGMQVFEHVFRLPSRFFEHRPTGVLVARIHGIETRNRQGNSGARRRRSKDRSGADAHGYSGFRCGLGYRG